MEEIKNNNEEKKEIEKVKPAISIEGMLTERYIEEVEKQIEFRQKLLMKALRALKPHDLQDFDGKPYLEGEGAARIMSVVRGFKVGEAKFITELIAPHYFVECSIPMEFMGATTVAIGDCSTADAFFTGREGNAGRYAHYKNQTGSETMAARLLLGDAKKKARENAISRGVCELLGIKGLTWGDLKALGFGFSPEQAGTQIKFKTGSQSGEKKVVTVSEALQCRAGSKIDIKGKVVDVKERQLTKKDGTKTTVSDYSLTDDVLKIKVSIWGSILDDLKTNQTLFCEDVTVNTYQGALQFTAKTISIVAEEQEEIKNGNNTNGTKAE